LSAERISVPPLLFSGMLDNNMDDKRKRVLTAGVIVGAVTVGLIVLAKRTPKEKWGETLVKISRDGLKLVKMRYGALATPVIELAERALDRIEEGGDTTPKIA